MTTLHLFYIFAILVPLTMTGIEMAVALVNPVLKGLPSHLYLEVSPALATRFGRVMPFWYVSSVALSLVATWLRFRQTHLLDPSIVSACALYVVTVLISVTLLVPLNKRIAAKNGTAAELRAVQDAWDRRHRVRVVILLIADILLLGALAA